MLGGFEEVTGALLVTGYWLLVTKGYWKLQGVTGSYKGVQGVLNWYDGLQTVGGHFKD